MNPWLVRCVIAFSGVLAVGGSASSAEQWIWVNNNGWWYRARVSTWPTAEGFQLVPNPQGLSSGGRTPGTPPGATPSPGHPDAAAVAAKPSDLAGIDPQRLLDRIQTLRLQAAVGRIEARLGMPASEPRESVASLISAAQSGKNGDLVLELLAREIVQGGATDRPIPLASDVEIEAAEVKLKHMQAWFADWTARGSKATVDAEDQAFADKVKKVAAAEAALRSRREAALVPLTIQYDALRARLPADLQKLLD